MSRASDHGLLAPEEISLFVDQYELAMAASYFRRRMNDRVVFELFVGGFHRTGTGCSWPGWSWRYGWWKPCASARRSWNT